jgi:hypothetical protein
VLSDLTPEPLQNASFSDLTPTRHLPAT